MWLRKSIRSGFAIQNLQPRIALLIMHVNWAAPLEAESIALIITKSQRPAYPGM